MITKTIVIILVIYTITVRANPLELLVLVHEKSLSQPIICRRSLRGFGAGHLRDGNSPNDRIFKRKK